MYDPDQEDRLTLPVSTESRLIQSDPFDRLPHGGPSESRPSEDDAKTIADWTLWREMSGHYLHEIEVQSHNRAHMEQDEAYYDGDQWSAADSAVLQERGQEPIVYNIICTALNWVFGTERRTRTDYKVLPRRAEGAQAAERKSQILKYISDTNRTEFSVSRAFQDSTKVGVGWLEAALQDEDNGEPLHEGSESWRNMLWDSAATRDDLEDARFIFRSKWIDTDTAVAFFPEAGHIIERASADIHGMLGTEDTFGDEAMDAQEEFATDSTVRDPHFADTERKRVRMVEAWFKKPTKRQRIVGGDFSGELFDPSSPGHFQDLQGGRAQLRESVVMQTSVMIFTNAGPVYHSVSPYRHNKYPFTPIWGYRRGRDGQPYGLVRNIVGMQDDINKRASKALAIMSSNRIVMEAGMVDDLDELEEEAARPNGIIVLKNSSGRFELDSDRGMDAPHLEMMSRTISLIQATSGITDENLGRQTNAASGKAIMARQDQGSLATSLLFDNLRLARQIHGEKMLSLSEQFMTKEKTFRITNSRGSPSYVTINDGLPQNDIVRTKADFIISEDSWDATLRQSKAAELSEMMQTIGPVMPEIMMVTLDLLFESMDLPNGDEIVKRVRQVTGMMDPDTDLQNPDPETAAMLEQRAAKQEKQSRMEDAELAKNEAEAAEKMAKADKTTQETQKILAALPGEDIAAKEKALQLAIEMLNARAALPVADQLLAEAGFSFAPPPSALPPAPPPPAPQEIPPQGMQP